METRDEKISIRISKLSDGIHEYHFNVEPAVLALAEEFREPVKIDLRLDKSHRQISATANIATSAAFSCDRCTEGFTRPVASKYAMVFVSDETDAGGLPEDQVALIDMNSPELDLTDDMRQSIELAVPLKLLCRDDCKGLCPRCGTNRNTGSCDCTTE